MGYQVVHCGKQYLVVSARGKVVGWHETATQAWEQARQANRFLAWVMAVAFRDAQEQQDAEQTTGEERHP